jgi:heme exporter protein A
LTGAAISAQGLAKRFGRAVALAGLDLEVEAGCSLAVLGPNGAGKSTLLRLIAGLTRPTAGTLTIDGENTQRRAVRARVGYIGHATLLYPALTARENLIFAGRLHGVQEPGRRADALLEEEGLSRVAGREVGGFSRGMAQRVAIARGLVHDPAIVLLDEPFTGLDRSAAERLTRRLETLRDGGSTLVLVTHEIARAARLADSTIVLERGRVVHESRGVSDAAGLERAYEEAVDAGP